MRADWESRGSETGSARGIQCTTAQCRGAVQEGHVGAYPTVIFDDNAFSRDSLFPDGDIESVILMILGVKAHVLPHDHTVADEDPTAGTDIRVGIHCRALPGGRLAPPERPGDPVPPGPRSGR